MARRDAAIDLERELWEDGRVVVGIDEVGKGSWAGPLMVGAVVIPIGDRLPGVRDSKAMTERARESIFDELADWCAHWSIGVVSATECDTLGMSAAQRLACRRALEGLGVEADVAISDGRWDFVSPLVPEVVMRVGADADSLSVAAASVLAKVTRDREMRALALIIRATRSRPTRGTRVICIGRGSAGLGRRSSIDGRGPLWIRPCRGPAHPAWWPRPGCSEVAPTKRRAMSATMKTTTFASASSRQRPRDGGN